VIMLCNSRVGSRRTCEDGRAKRAFHLAIRILYDSLPMSSKSAISLSPKLALRNSLKSSPHTFNINPILKSLACTVYDFQLRERLPRFLPHQHHTSAIPISLYTLRISATGARRCFLEFLSILVSFCLLWHRDLPRNGGLRVSCYFLFEKPSHKLVCYYTGLSMATKCICSQL